MVCRNTFSLYFVGEEGHQSCWYWDTVVLWTHRGYNRVHNSEIYGDERRVCFGASLGVRERDRASFRRESHLGESGDVSWKRRDRDVSAEGWPKCWLIYLMRVEGKKWGYGRRIVDAEEAGLGWDHWLLFLFFFFMLFSRFLLRIIEIYRNKEEILIVGSLSFLRMLFQSRFSFEVTKVFQINWTWEKSYQVIQKRKYRSLIYRLCFLRILFQCNFFKVTKIYRLILKSRVSSFKHAFINSNHSRSTSNVI